MINEYNEDAEKEKNLNPYQRLRYVNELASFYMNLAPQMSGEDFEAAMQRLKDLTDKYKDS